MSEQMLEPAPRRSPIGGVAIAAYVVIAAELVTIAYSRDLSPHHTNTPSASSNVHPYLPPACPSPTAADFAATNKLFNQPGNPTLNPYVNFVQPPVVRMENLYHQTAANLGLHIYGSPAQAEALANERPKDHSFAFYLSQTQAYMRQLGVSVKVGAGADAGFGSRTPTSKELETTAAKANVLDIAREFYEVPEELIGLSGLRTIRIVTGTKNAAAYAVSEKPSSTIYLDIQGKVSDETEKHEFTHLIDATECPDSTENDPAFVKLTPNAATAYKSSNNNVPSYTGDWRSEAYALSRDQALAAISQDKSGFCKDEAKLYALAGQIQTYSDYHPDVVEDKAETGKNIFIPERYTVLANEHFTVLYQKFKLLFARLYHLSPQIATYYARISPRPAQETFPGDPTC